MFRDVSHRLTDAGPLRGYGASVTPGRDGPLVFVGGYGEPNRLYAREADDYVDTACGIVADADRHALGVVAADLDADGCEELYVHNCDGFAGFSDDGDLLLDRLEAERYRWTDCFSLDVNERRGNHRAGRSVAALDRFGTGRYGAAVTGYGSPTAFFELGDDGEASDMAPAVGLTLDCFARSLVAAPLVSEGMDLFVGVDDGPNRLFRNDGGHYEAIPGAAGLADPDGDARGVTLVDEGGEFAVAVGNWDGPCRLFRPDDAGRFRDASPPAMGERVGTRTVLAADFDNDGRQELFCNALGEPNRLYARDEADEWERAVAGDADEPGGFGTGAVVADLDGDGALELVVVHGEIEAQPVTVYEVPDAADRDWLRIRPTTQYGAPARGALVTLETDAGSQCRAIDAGSGYLCQSEPVAHFGLGDATPERVTVRWPDGREAVLDDVSPRTEREVDHPIAPRF